MLRATAVHLAAALWLAAATGSGGGAPSRGLQEYDCLVEGDWSSEQLYWCCVNQGLGCPKTSTSPPPTTSTTPPFNCRSHFEHWEQVWPEEKVQWCCANFGLGCAGLAKAAAESVGAVYLSSATNTTTTLTSASLAMDFHQFAPSGTEPSGHGTSGGTSTPAAASTAVSDSSSQAAGAGAAAAVATTIGPDATTSAARAASSAATTEETSPTTGAETTAGAEETSVAMEAVTTTAAKSASPSEAAPVATGTQAAAASGQLFNCSSAAATWTAAERDWCCFHRGRGCGPAPEQVSVGTSACDAICELKGESATCADRIGVRIHASAAGDREVCLRARQNVVSSCHACAGCSAEQACPDVTPRIGSARSPEDNSTGFSSSHGRGQHVKVLSGKFDASLEPRRPAFSPSALASVAALCFGAPLAAVGAAVVLWRAARGGCQIEARPPLARDDARPLLP